MNIVIRADASLHIGTGHVMRCKTLADELRRRGAEVRFICRDHPGNLISLLRDAGHQVIVLPAPKYEGPRTADREDYATWLGVEQSEDAQQVLEVLGDDATPDWLIVDHYALDAVWERALRHHTSRIMVIDDLADRDHDADLLLDQNIQPSPERYDDHVAVSCVRLLGPTFALLRPEFAQLRTNLVPRSGEIRRVLVYVGGGDVRNVTSTMLDALAQADVADMTIDVVLGQGNPHKDTIRARCTTLRHCNLHVQTSNMADLMAQADLMIGGAGSSTWERFCLGVPSVLISIADNQRAIGREAARKRAAVYLGDDQNLSQERLTAIFNRIFRRYSLNRRMSCRALKIVDGHGAERVAAALLGHLRFTIVSDPDSWINVYLSGLVDQWRGDGHAVVWVHDPGDVPHGDCAFYLSCSRVADSKVLARNDHNLVVHESDLPRGRGWSPLTWQILEGATEVPITLFEATEKVDSGPIYFQRIMPFSGHELIGELRDSQAMQTIELCRMFVSRYPAIVSTARPQKGQPSYYPRRRPEDSRLDPMKTIAEQFELLRVVDNDRYPAYFHFRGRRYTIRIDSNSPDAKS